MPVVKKIGLYLNCLKEVEYALTYGFSPLEADSVRVAVIYAAVKRLLNCNGDIATAKLSAGGIDITVMRVTVHQVEQLTVPVFSTYIHRSASINVILTDGVMWGRLPGGNESGLVK
jgi:hypothetical protein